jgi:type I restriction enzyme S subunit
MELKKGYKQTEVGVIPVEWEVFSLSQLTDPQRPISYGIVQTGPNIPDGIPCLRVLDIHEGKISRSGLISTSQKISASYRRTILKAGDLVMPLRGKVGDVGLVNEELQGANLTRGVALIAIRAGWSSLFCQQIISAASTRRRLEQAMNGSALQEIPIAALRSFRVALPPLPEQRAIAEALSDVDGLLSGLDRLIAKKRDLKQAAMQQLLTGQTRLPGFDGEWEVKTLGEVAEIEMGQSPSSSNYNTHGDGLPLIQGNADVEDRKTIIRVFTTEVTKRGRIGDVLMSVRAPVGEVSRATFDVCLGRGVCAIRYPNDFLFQYLIFIEPTWVRHSKGSTFDSVNSIDVRAVEIHLPPTLPEQTAIAAVLSDMDAELAALEERREKTRQLKQGMMQELLTGRTRLV